MSEITAGTVVKYFDSANKVTVTGLVKETFTDKHGARRAIVTHSGQFKDYFDCEIGQFALTVIPRYEILNNQYLPFGFGRAAETYYYIKDVVTGRYWHKNGKWRNQTLKDLTTYWFKTEAEAQKTIKGFE